VGQAAEPSALAVLDALALLLLDEPVLDEPESDEPESDELDEAEEDADPESLELAAGTDADEALRESVR
jgi:hypothetical protein